MIVLLFRGSHLIHCHSFPGNEQKVASFVSGIDCAARKTFKRGSMENRARLVN